MQERHTFTELKRLLLERDIRHFLVRQSYIDRQGGNLASEHKLKRRDMAKIYELISNHMVLRLASPDTELFWYSLKDDEENPKIVLNIDDAQRFPIMFMQEASSRFSTGRKEDAIRMMEIALKAVISKDNKRRAYNNIGLMYANVLDYKSALKSYETAIAMHPGYVKAYNNLGTAYEAVRQDDRAGWPIKKP